MPAKHRFEGNICIHGHFNKSRGSGVFDYYPDDQSIYERTAPAEPAADLV
jgi:hypothetical protein